MRLPDVAHFASRSLTGYRTRTLLMVLAMSIGVAAVVVLTSLGEGARRYVRNQFESLGTNLIIVLPGRTETFGGTGGLVSGRTPRDLTLEDALALRRIRGITRVVPLNLVSGEVSWNGRRRDGLSRGFRMGRRPWFGNPRRRRRQTRRFSIHGRRRQRS